MLTTNYLPVIQDISHNQITESRSCGNDDANATADADDAAAATDAADTDATDAAAAAATAAVAAAMATTHSCQTCVTLVGCWEVCLLDQFQDERPGRLDHQLMFETVVGEPENRALTRPEYSHACVY